MNDLPQIVRQRLQTAQAGTHPEPNLLNALAEHGLMENERREVLAHLSECGECREVVFLAQPELQANEAFPARSRWLGWCSLRWATAAACVVIVAAAVSLRHPQPDRAVRSVGIAANSLSKSSSPSSSPSPAELDQPENRDKKPSVAMKRKEALRRDSTEAMAAAPYALSPNPQNEKKVDAGFKNESSANSTSQDNKLTAPQRANAGAWRSDESAPQLKQKSDAPAVNTGARQAISQAMIAAPAALAPKWRLDAEGSPQRLRDASKGWETVEVSEGGPFAAIFSLGNEVWVGGARGALYHSVDAGIRWALMEPKVDGRSLTDDVTAIEFLDAQHGKLTTSNHEVWTTEDAGQSWKRE